MSGYAVIRMNYYIIACYLSVRQQGLKVCVWNEFRVVTCFSELTTEL